MPNYFITMEQLERWSSQGKIRLSGDSMTVLADGRVYELVPAVRFVEELGDSNDSRGLVGKVIPLAELALLGGEHYMDSVVIDETAYKVAEVYIARLLKHDLTRASIGDNGESKKRVLPANEIDDADLVAGILLGE